ncbi:MAG: ATP-binding domain-containing protein, partial [Planctomycetes bacterium]|nr:ATP-binding domain-containing protein [Planctomycetota bacterium]
KDPLVLADKPFGEWNSFRIIHVGERVTAVDRAANVDELVNAAYEYGRRQPDGGIDGFVQENALVSDQDAYDAGAETVSLMTVHSAKGLEFPCVLVSGLEEGLLPHAFSMGDEEETEEERRLFYVAITRAQDELFLLHAATRMRQGMAQRNPPSRFLDEIPDEFLLVEDRGASGLGRPAPWGVQEEEPVFEREDPHGGLKEGDKVRHHHFGKGRVLAVRRAGGATRVTVDFVEAGRRELSLAYAKLDRI